MRNQKETIRKMVNYLNNEEKDGGFWLPNIQRPFVWSEEQSASFTYCYMEKFNPTYLLSLVLGMAIALSVY